MSCTLPPPISPKREPHRWRCGDCDWRLRDHWRRLCAALLQSWQQHSDRGQVRPDGGERSGTLDVGQCFVSTSLEYLMYLCFLSIYGKGLLCHRDNVIGFSSPGTNLGVEGNEASCIKGLGYEWVGLVQLGWVA
jgi:hypothetical protein